LGYNIYRYYFSYQFITPKKREEIIKYMVNNKYSLWVTSIEGQFDLSVYMAVKDVNDFYHIWDDAFRKYNKYFSKRSFSVMCSFKTYAHAFLIDEQSKNVEKHESLRETGGKTTVKTDKLDIDILKLLSQDGRIQIKDLSEKLKCSTQTINNRIRNLKKSGIIDGFSIEINYLKFGYKLYRLDINLNEDVKKQPILDFFIKNPFTLEIYGSIGDAADIEIEIILKDVSNIHQIIDSISNKYTNSIKEYKYHSIVKRHKVIGIPEI
jgi:Lrp/AsnC family leucine-responsive transcriptional regulator